jgi:hypothetical protein
MAARWVILGKVSKWVVMEGQNVAEGGNARNA